ncbi:MAG: GHKL domain-containing protein [Candidatus Cloacimonetes bacterium]|nr:GHKL domain-containing protein [Candidatus Cloacimonadota bacterium]
MDFKNFRFQVLLHILIIATNIALLMITFKHWLFLSVLLALTLIATICHLLFYINSVVHTVSSFLNALLHSDTSIILDLHKLGNDFNDISNNAVKIKEMIYQSKTEKEEQIYCLNQFMEHLEIGIIAFDEQNKIEFINYYAKKLLKISHVADLTQQNKSQNPLYDYIMNLSESGSKVFKSEDWNSKTLSIQSNHIQFKNKVIKLISIKDIKSEMDEQEINSWQKLIRVLTHEIMNSITPITSLSATASALIKSSDQPSEFSEDIQNAILTIHKRSSGLISFVDSFRNLVKIPEAHLTSVKVKTLFDSLHQMIQSDLQKHQIDLQISIEPDTTISILTDESLLQQALINLLNNAMDAVKESADKQIMLKAVHYQDDTLIQLTDNGMGIDSQNLENIFIPFFTTKKSGNGIGLSIVKQILFKLKADINVHSEPNQGCRFDIKIRNLPY